MNNTVINKIIPPPAKSPQNQLEYSVKNYHDITRKHINKYLTKLVDKRIIQYVLRNEDFFNHMVTAVMMADWSFDENRSSKKYWRTQNCMYVLRYALRYNNVSQPNNEDKEFNFNSWHQYRAKSLDEKLLNLSGNLNYTSPDIECEKNEEYEVLYKEIFFLKKKYRKIIEGYYFNGKTQQQLSKIYNVSQPYINQVLRIAVKKLRNEMEWMNV